jgi:hypothetical protein
MLKIVLPPNVGDRITIPNIYAIRRQVEAHGFWPEAYHPDTCVMRRISPEGILKTDY